MAFYMSLAGGKRDLNQKVGEKSIRLGKVGYIWLFNSAVSVRKGRMMREWRESANCGTIYMRGEVAVIDV